jgi:hypothetical protein
MINRVEELDIFGKPKVIFTSDKRDITYEVTKLNMGSSLWRVKCGTGNVPKALQGSWTKMDDAEKAVVKYLEKTKVTRTVKAKQLETTAETN